MRGNQNTSNISEKQSEIEREASIRHEIWKIKKEEDGQASILAHIAPDTCLSCCYAISRKT